MLEKLKIKFYEHRVIYTAIAVAVVIGGARFLVQRPNNPNFVKVAETYFGNLGETNEI